jgi:hypothetical protein
MLFCSVLAVGTNACSGLLDVSLPGRITDESLNDPKLAPTLAASVVADAECAFDTYAVGAAFLSDQFLAASGALGARLWGTKHIPDGGYGQVCGQLGAYSPLHIARVLSENIRARLDQWTDAEAGIELAPLKAKVAVYGAYTYLFLGEGYCQMRLDASGTIITPAAVLAVAETKFTEALSLAQAADSADLMTLAYAGRARVRLDLGKNADATADADQVPAGWARFVTRDINDGTRFNSLWLFLTEGYSGSVAPEYRDLHVAGTPDPRVVVKAGPESGFGLPATGFDGTTPLYVVTNKNTSRSSPERLASSVEAQLIKAEALGGSEAIAIIDARRDALGLPHYPGATDPASVTALILDERNREFFMEGGQRINDLLRYHIPWKTGKDQYGDNYGPTTCLPLAKQEGGS